MRLAFFGFFVAIISSFTTPAFAGDRVLLGFGRLLTNDWFGDGQDRWHTGSMAVSMLRGPEGLQGLPSEFGTLLEYRLGTALIAPASLTAPDAGDRPYAGILSLGVHSHFIEAGYEVSAGIDIVATGPQTGQSNIQTAFHNLIGNGVPSAAILAGQIPDAIYPTALLEIARPFTIAENLTFRAFTEAQIGVESFARIGGDFRWGSAWGPGVFVRDATTGQVYQSARIKAEPGISVLLGGDMARVFSSALLPVADGYQLAEFRNRARLGLHLQGEKASVFYGVTWLGRTFAAQPEGQLVGAVRIGISF